MHEAEQTRRNSSDDGEHALDMMERDALQIRLDRAELALLDQRERAQDQIIHHKLATEYVADERIKTTLGEVSALHRAEVEDTVSLVRAVLAGECPVETYYRLKQIRPELLTTREWLTVTLWETIQPLKEEVQRLRTHNNMLKSDLKQGNLRAEKHTQDLLFIQKSVEQHAEIYQRQIQELTREKLKMKTQLEKLSVELEHQQKKLSANPVVLEAENRDLKNLIEVLQHKITLLEAVDSENPNTVKTVGDLHQHKKLLQSELMYMTSKDAAHEAILHTAESKIKDLEKRVQDLTDCNEKYLAELLKKREESDAEMYQKGRSALNSQNLHHQEDLIKLRDNMEKEHRTRENILRDSRDEAELRLKRAEAELKQVSNEYTCLKLESGRSILILEDSLREARTRIKLKDQELAKLESCLHEIESNAKLQRMENVTLIERFEASRVEISKLANQKSIREENAERQKLELELKLEEFEKVSEHVDQVFSRLALQDKEWQGAYARSVMVVPHGPKKLLAITDVLRRLEQKVSEVNILRTEIKELKEAAERARDERRVMVDALSGGPNPTKHLTQMVLERHEALQEDRRVQERMQTDYHVLFRELQEFKAENQKLKTQIEGLLVKRKNIEHIQKILADILSNRGGYKDTALLERLKAAWI